MKQMFGCLLVVLLLAAPGWAADYEIYVTTPWTGAGTITDPIEHAIFRDYPFIRIDWNELTQQDVGGPTAAYPDPNLDIIRVVVDEAVLDAIEADPDYEVLASEEIIEVAP